MTIQTMAVSRKSDSLVTDAALGIATLVSFGLQVACGGIVCMGFSGLPINCFDLFANWAFLMQFEPKLDLENPDDLKVYRSNDNYIKESMAIYSHRPAQYKYDPNDERAMAVNEEQVKLKNYMTIAEAELLTASTAEAFETKYAGIQQVWPTMYDQELVLAYTNDALQAGKAQLGVKFFWPPYAEAE